MSPSDFSTALVLLLAMILLAGRGGAPRKDKKERCAMCETLMHGHHAKAQ